MDQEAYVPAWREMAPDRVLDALLEAARPIRPPTINAVGASSRRPALYDAGCNGWSYVMAWLE